MAKFPKNETEPFTMDTPAESSGVFTMDVPPTSDVPVQSAICAKRCALRDKLVTIPADVAYDANTFRECEDVLFAGKWKKVDDTYVNTVQFSFKDGTQLNSVGVGVTRELREAVQMELARAD